MTANRCPGCGIALALEGLIACAQCWLRLPVERRSAVNLSYRDICDDGSTEYRKAADAAADWLRANPASAPVAPEPSRDWIIEEVFRDDQIQTEYHVEVDFGDGKGFVPRPFIDTDEKTIRDYMQGIRRPKRLMSRSVYIEDWREVRDE